MPNRQESREESARVGAWICFLVAAVFVAHLSVPRLPFAAAQAVSDYLLGPGDVLDVNVLGQTDLTRQLVIRPDGKISMPLVGEILAAGLTPEQLTLRLTTGLKAYLVDPRVTIVVTQTRTAEALVYLVGEIRNPGSYEYRRGWTVMEAIVQAGGVTEKAALKKASLIRRGSNQSFPLDLDRLIRRGDQGANLPVEGGDVILIPEFLNRVIVVGAVKTPGAYDLQEEARVLDALVRAGGPTEKAVVRSIIVTRQAGDRRVVVASIDFSKLVRGDNSGQNITLQHGDVIYVPDTRIRFADLLSWLAGLSMVKSIFGF